VVPGLGRVIAERVAQQIILPWRECLLLQVPRHG